MPEVRGDAAFHLRGPGRCTWTIPQRDWCGAFSGRGFATGSRALYRKHGRVIGENCRAIGFNVDFAPVLDLAYELRER